jgi:hypothetical protein
VRQSDRGPLASALAQRLGDGAARIVWEDGGDAVLVRLDRLTARCRDEQLVVELELAADELGCENLSLRFALGEDEAGELVAATDSVAAAGGPIAARWWTIAQDAVWAALTELVGRGGRSELAAPAWRQLEPLIRRAPRSKR